MKKLSILITFHQYKNYLKECFHALKDSSFIDFELILVLDQVSEKIEDLIKQYQEVFDLKVVILKNGHGVAAARNEVIKAASGEFVYFLDSDDYLLEDTLANIHACLDSQVDIVYGTMNNTWNNKANYLEKKLKKLSELDEEEMQMKEDNREARIMEYVRENVQYGDEQKIRGIYHLVRKRKGFRSITVLGNAYRKAFLEENNLTFDESLIYYSDLPFLLQACEMAKTLVYAKEAIYVKRKHNDPINYPALRQIEDDNRFYDRMQAFVRSRALLDDQGLVRYLLDRKIITYYLYNFARRLRRSENPLWRNEYFNALSDVVIHTREDVLFRLKRWQRKMVVALQNKDLTKVWKLVRFRLAKIKFKKMLKNKNVFYKLAYYHIFLKKPLLDNVIVFETFTGKNYADSPKYIYEYLAQHYSNQFKFVWVLNTKTKPAYDGIKVRRFSFRYAYYLARAKYLVFNARQPLWFRKREGQIFLETWHGTPLKCLVFDQEEVTAASPKYKKEFYKQRKDWDYLISANDFSTETLKRCFMFEGEMLAYGYPRNDILYAEDKEEKAIAIKKKLNIPLDKKTILYAPTWRDDEFYGKGQYKFTLRLDLALLRERLKDEYVILLRTHQYIADALDISGLEGFAYNVSKYDDISELYLISDICITDYSSVFFDYANLKRPILFYTYDIEKYKNQLRGFYIDMEKEVPGPLLYTSEEVVKAIENIEQVNEQYAKRYQDFYDRFCHLDDGNASKKVVERVFLKQK
ncbi:MAG: CDP-glycerol:glycerophosphate glycerophosphotransferase [Erysipelotrichia bacterium]|nr:CDP-glycerol:glycerophosphate glycerophosphotransferase [Erysipelotrichia bacterium]